MAVLFPFERPVRGCQNRFGDRHLRVALREVDRAVVLGNPGHLADDRLIHQPDDRIDTTDHAASLHGDAEIVGPSEGVIEGSRCP